MSLEDFGERNFENGVGGAQRVGDPMKITSAGSRCGATRLSGSMIQTFGTPISK